MRHVPLDEMPEAFQAKVKTMQELGVDTRFLEVAANAPHILDFYWGPFYQGVFNEGVVDRRIKELVRLHLSNVHGCVQCKAANTIQSGLNGITQEEMDGLWDFENGPFSDRDKAVLRVATGISLADPLSTEIKPEVREDLSNYLSDAEIIELIMVCGVLTGFSRMAFAFDLVDKSESCPIVPTV